MSKKTSVNVRINSELRKALEKLAVENDFTVAGVIREAIKHYLKPDKVEDYDIVMEACPLLLHLEEEEAPTGKNQGEGYYCLKKAPVARKLGSGLKKAAEKYCSKCAFKEQYLVDSAEIAMQKKEGIKLDMPRCLKGGYPSEDMTELYCPLIGKFRPVKERKKKKDYKPCRLAGNNNANCQHLKYINVIRGLKEKDGR